MEELLKWVGPPEEYQNIDWETRRACQTDLALFGKTYIPEYVKEDYEDHHREIFRVMGGARRSGRIIVILLPRGAGKTTILFIVTLHAVLYGLEPYIVQIEHDGELAEEHCQKFVKVFEENHAVRRDFPEVRPSIPWSPSAGELNFSNGVLIRCMGLNQLRSRGSTHHESRITFAVANDLVDLNNARSPAQTKFIYDLLMKDLAKAGPLPGQGVLRRCYLGTSLSQTDAVWMLTASPVAHVIKIPAINGDEEKIKEFVESVSMMSRQISDYCEELENSRDFETDEETVMRDTIGITDKQRWTFIRRHREIFQKYFTIPDEGQEQNFEDIGPLKSYWARVYSMAFLTFDAAEDTAAFMQERLHQTGDIAFQRFHAKWFLPYTNLPEDSEDNWIYGMSIDPSGKPQEGTDPMAIYAGAYNRRRRELYTLECWSDQATPKELVEKTYDIFWRCFSAEKKVTIFLEDTISFSGVGIELFESIRKNKISENSGRKATQYWGRLPIKVVKPTGNKLNRIAAIRPFAEQGRIYIKPGHSQQELLIKQFVRFSGRQAHGILPIEFKLDLPDMLCLFRESCLARTKITKPFVFYGEAEGSGNQEKKNRSLREKRHHGGFEAF